MDHLFENNDIFGGHFTDWRRSRVSMMEKELGENYFQNKTVLECGAGFGNVGLYLQDKGADVTFTDAREECIKEILRKDPNAKTFFLDHDNDWNFTEHFDCVIHFGLSYNLQNWKRDLTCAIKNMREYLIYETAVNKFHEDIEFLIQDYNYYHDYHGPANSTGSLPSIRTIENVFDRYANLTYTRYDDEYLNVHNLSYTKNCVDTFVAPRDENGNVMKPPYIVDGWDSPFVSGGRKFWIIKKTSLPNVGRKRIVNTEETN